MSDTVYETIDCNESDPVYVNIKCRVASEWCVDCPELEFEQDKSVLRLNDRIFVRNQLVCKNLYKCQNILWAKRRFEDEQDT